jgi:hypothetical protein
MWQYEWLLKMALLYICDEAQLREGRLSWPMLHSCQPVISGQVYR